MNVYIILYRELEEKYKEDLEQEQCNKNTEMESYCVKVKEDMDLKKREEEDNLR